VTIRKRLALRYSIVAGICLVLIAALSYQELVIEPHFRERGRKQNDESEMEEWLEYGELAIHLTIPVVLGCGWWFMRRTLSPINKLADHVEQLQATTLKTPLPVRGNGDEVDRLTMVFNDMAQRLDRSFVEMRTFTLNVSHELKTPLTIMQIQLETMREANPPPGHVDWIECQLGEVQRLTRIVDALTLLAKAGVGLIEMDMKPLRLDALVQECFEDARILAEPHGIRVTLAPLEPLSIMGDRDRIWQLLLNLMDNAIKYNQPDGTIEMALQCLEGQAALTVTNTGAGISPELQSRIFERFVRGDEARRRSIDGSGLGLSICKWIVQAHNGSIQLQSAPDHRTTAIVSLPLAPQT
jgi:signal transduction histidine kinase